MVFYTPGFFTLFIYIFTKYIHFFISAPVRFPCFVLFLNPRKAHAFTNTSPKCWLLSKPLIAALSRQASMLLTCWRCACVISVISPIWWQAQQAASWSTQSLPKKQSLSLMLQKSKLTLCVSNPQATVWNSSGLESLRNFPQPYNVSQSAMRNRLLWARNRILLPLSTLSPCCWQKKSQKATVCGAVIVKTEPLLVVQKKPQISAPQHPTINLQRQLSDE